MYREDSYDTFTLANPITSRRLHKLCVLLDRCRSNDEYVVVIRKIARTQHSQAIEVLAAILDSPGPVGLAAVEGLARFGLAVVPEMKRVIRESLDSDAIDHAQMVVDRVRKQHREVA